MDILVNNAAMGEAASIGETTDEQSRCEHDDEKHRHPVRGDRNPLQRTISAASASSSSSR